MADTRLNGHQEACSCRSCRIQILLEHLQDVEDRGATGGITQDAETGVPMMGVEWHHPSYVELRRILFLMLAQPLLKNRRHMLAYMEAPKRPRTRKTKIQGPRGKRIDAEIRVLEPLIPAWVSLDRVLAGLAFVEEQFRGDPSLPDAFWKQAA